MVEDLVELSDETRREQQRFKGLRRRTCLTRRDCVFDCDENTSFCSYKYIMRSCFSFLIYLRRYWCHVYKCFEECENIIRVRRKLWTKTGKIIEGKLEILKFFLSFGQIVSLTTARTNITSKLRYCVSNVGHCNSSVEQVSLKFLRKIHSRYRFLEFYSSRRLIINLGDFYAKFYVKYRRVGFSLFRWYSSRINFSSNSKEAIHFLRHCSPSPLSLRTFPFFELNALFIKWLQANIFFPG